jgi:hypothetical protein
LKEQEEIQRKKMEEIERKLETTPAPTAFRPTAFVAGGGKSSWRDRVAAKEAVGQKPTSAAPPPGTSSAARTAVSETAGLPWRSSHGDQKPSAFSSIKSKEGSSDSKPSGPPKIGSGKWSAHRQS